MTEGTDIRAADELANAERQRDEWKQRYELAATQATTRGDALLAVTIENERLRARLRELEGGAA